MMKYMTILALMLFTLTAFNTSSIYTPLEQTSFDPGERIEYKVKFGFINIANAHMEIQPQTYSINGRDCYKMDVYGKTTGLAKWINTVDDHWGAYVDTEALLPQVSYRNIKEGNYRKNEVLNFDHDALKVESKVLDQKSGEFKEPNEYKIPEDVRGLISSFSYLRTIDFAKHKTGDIIKVDAFFENTLYNMEVIYVGKDRVKTKIGKINAIKLIPVMPDNKLFDGENAITVWLSDDSNKIPLKIDADMFVGHAKMEIVDFKNLKSELNRVI